MSWMPSLRIGFWNAWIPMLVVVFHPMVMRLVDNAFGKGDLSIKMGEAPLVEGQKRPISIPTLLQILLFFFSIFLPLKLGTAWFYVGSVIYVAGVVMFLNAMVTAAKTPIGKVFSGGIYRYSRHPLYVSFIFIFLGISIASASWLFLLLSMGWMIFPLSYVNAEEKGCIDSFGDDYREYMRGTPKWLGIPKNKPLA